MKHSVMLAIASLLSIPLRHVSPGGRPASGISLGGLSNLYVVVICVA